MKARWTFIVLGLLFLLLLGGIGWLFQLLFREKEIPSTSPVPSSSLHSDAGTSLVTEVVIDATPSNTPSARPDTQPKPLPKPRPAPLPANALLAEVSRLSGKAYAQQEPEKEAELTPAMKLTRKHSLRTEPGARVELTFIDGTVLSVGEKSRVVLEDYAFDLSQPEKACFLLRVTEGMCRVITGKITALNPDRFRVKTRMATMGIRGCELAFDSRPDLDRIYVLSLSGPEKVTVEYTKNGQPVRDAATGEMLPMKPDQMETTVISLPNTVITITRGQGAQSEKMTPADLRAMTQAISGRPSARIETKTTGTQTTIEIAPEKPPAAPTTP